MALERTLRRRIARRLYDRFSAAWRRDNRLAGRYGKRGTAKPRFSDWWTMHLKEISQMEASTPEDVREYVGDPWAEDAPAAEPAPTEERGVTTVPISGDE